MDERPIDAATFTKTETTVMPWRSAGAPSAPSAPSVATWVWFGFTYIPPAELEGWVSPMR
jgi:hypothetical protein